MAALAVAAALAGCAARAPPGSVLAVRHAVADGADLVDEIVTLRTREGVTQSYLLCSIGGASSTAVAVLFPGGDGRVGLPGDIRDLKRGANFLVRSRDLFRTPELAVAVVDVPSDRAGGMDDGFRAGPEHARDVGAVVANLRTRFPGARLYLVGTSRGTVSAAHLGRALGRAVDGVVLTSTVFVGNVSGRGLSGFDFGGIPTPLLLVHHADDSCPLCPYSAAAALARNYPLITVRGGEATAAGACGPWSAHGYLGREAATVQAIRAWMLGKPYPASID